MESLRKFENAMALLKKAFCLHGECTDVSGRTMTANIRIGTSCNKHTNVSWILRLVC